MVGTKKPVCQGAIRRWNAIFLTAQSGAPVAERPSLTLGCGM